MLLLKNGSDAGKYSAFNQRAHGGNAVWFNISSVECMEIYINIGKEPI